MTKSRFFLKILIGIAGAVSLFIFAVASILAIAAVQLVLKGWVPWEPPSTQPVRGVLGGLPVAIPYEYVNLIEFEGQENFWKPLDPAKPKFKPTPDSVITGFIFGARYSDLAPVSLSDAGRSLPEPTISVSVTGPKASKDYSHFDKGTLRWLDSASENYLFHKQTETAPQFGLSTFEVSGYNELSKTFQESQQFKVYYRKHLGTATYIECMNSSYEKKFCSHRFNITAKVHIRVKMSYPLELLEHWEETERKVTDKILSWQQIN